MSGVLELIDASATVAERVIPAKFVVNSMEYSNGALSPTDTETLWKAVPFALEAPTLKENTPPAIGVPETTPVAAFTLIQPEHLINCRKCVFVAVI